MDFTVMQLLNWITSHEEPPWNEDDPLYERRPWKYFGCVSIGIVKMWRWYNPVVILAKATITDLFDSAKELSVMDRRDQRKRKGNDIPPLDDDVIAMLESGVYKDLAKDWFDILFPKG